MAYAAISALLVENNQSLSAAELQGVACGLLCANGQTTAAYWLEQVLDDDSLLPAAQQQLLTQLFVETGNALNSDSFEFNLLLPDDDDELLSDRIMALKNWCQGFLFGVGAAQVSKTLSSEAREILKDISEFTKLDTDAEGEADESAFTDITEYLRVAVILLHTELTNDNDPRTTVH